MLPSSVLTELEKTTGGSTFIEDIWIERFEVKLPTPVSTTVSVSCVASSMIEATDDTDEELDSSCCLVCERTLKLTRHHLYPRETHHTMLKKKKVAHKEELNETISICRLCHSTIHHMFTNIELANTFNTLEMLLSDERYLRYAKWASRLGSRTVH